MAKITKESILHAIEDLKAAGLRVTQAAVREQLGGGSFTTINKVMQEHVQEPDNVGELLRYPHAVVNLMRMGHAHNLPYSVQQLEFLGEMVHNAYQTGNQIVQGKYYASVLGAFLACYRLVEKQVDSSFFLHNLGFDDNHDIQAVVENKLQKMSEMVLRVDAEFGSRNLAVIIRMAINHGQENELRQALSKYMPDLLTLAARAAYEQQKKPFAQDDQSLYPVPDKISSENYWLHFQVFNNQLFVRLHLPSHHSTHVCIGFLEYQKLQAMFNPMSWKQEYRDEDVYRVSIAGSENRCIAIHYHSHQMEFSEDQAHEIHALFQKAEEQPDVRIMLDRIAESYGNL